MKVFFYFKISKIINFLKSFLGEGLRLTFLEIQNEPIPF